MFLLVLHILSFRLITSYDIKHYLHLQSWKCKICRIQQQENIPRPLWMRSKEFRTFMMMLVYNNHCSLGSCNLVTWGLNQERMGDEWHEKKYCILLVVETKQWNKQIVWKDLFMDMSKHKELLTAIKPILFNLQPN